MSRTHQARDCHQRLRKPTGAPCSPRRTWAENDGATPDSCHAAPPTSACAAFIKESRMESTSAIKLNRKSGGKPHQRSVFFFLPPNRSMGNLLNQNKRRVPHISLVFREMWDTTVLDEQPSPLSSRPAPACRGAEGPAFSQTPGTPQFDPRPVSRHDLSRAKKPTTKEGFSPCCFFCP